MQIDETDPLTVEEHRDDEPGEFLSMYRSVSANSSMDEFFVRGAVDNNVIPQTLRYGVMRKGKIEAYRGVVKATTGDLFYFNFSPGATFKLIKSDSPELTTLLKACQHGCDLRKAAPLEPGETVDDEEAEDSTDKGAVPIPSAASVPVSEDQSIAEQQKLRTDVHPGATTSGAPDDDNVGRDWHEPLVRAQDGLSPLATNDGKSHWSAVDLLKAYGKRLQDTAPSVSAQISTLEHQYMTEQLGVSATQISKGVRLAPRHQVAFAQWRATKLREKLTGLTKFVKS